MITLTIDENGTAKAIYSDELADYFAETGAKIARASHVEPCEGGWNVDLSPVGGPANVGPFKLRDEALGYEVSWLQKNYL